VLEVALTMTPHALPRHAGSVVVVVAVEDRFVGAESRRHIARVARPHGSSTLVELAGADHNNLLAAMSPERGTRCSMG